MPDLNELGAHLKSMRQSKNYTLRAVEKETEISNAYLSQLESGKIRTPSPKILFKLSELYQVPYASIMTMAGYPMPDHQEQNKETAFVARLGATSEEEQEALIEYLDFLRLKKNRRKE